MPDKSQKPRIGMKKKWLGRVPTRTSLAVSFLIVLFGIGSIAFETIDSGYFFKINKSLEILGRVYKEVSVNYVDEVDPEKLMESGIDGLLGTLDPYTNFISETEGDEVELITTGEYGGIGVTVGVRDGYITILSLMDGYSAQKVGLQVGDRIVGVEGKPVIGTKPEALRSMTRGEVGSEVRLRIQREGEEDTLLFTLIREQIHVKNVSYSCLIDSEIGYIKLDHFSRNAGNEMRLAIQDLGLKGQIKGLVLDLRDNPGGLLDAAVEVVEKFVPKGSPIVSTKGRKGDSEKKYSSVEEPMLPRTPLVVLVNHNSASASEIVTGAIQDLDRGVILGTRTFGKGLVQTITPLPYNNQLKITTAKYYTPSGRCIQEIDYFHRDNAGGVTMTADSLKHEFRTTGGRRVYERGGINPDTIIESPEASAINKELLRKLMYFKFATTYVAQHKNTSDFFRNDQTLLDKFKDFLTKQNFTFQDDGEKKLQEFQDVTEKAKYGEEVRRVIEELKKQVASEKINAYQKNLTEIRRELLMEIAGRYGGEGGRSAVRVQYDVQLKVAQYVLADAVCYERLLKTKDHGR